MPTPDGPSLKIYMPTAQSINFIKCWCTRWDENDYTVSVETFLGSANRNLLFSHITPGLYRELYNVLGKPKYIDGTFRKANTLWLEPVGGYGLSGLRKSRLVTVKNASDTIITPNYFNVKLECVRIDT
jgi:hypothetical protein